MATESRLVFTDLDGSLLDHHTYSFSAAQSQLDALALRGIPVIPVSSKTRAEIEPLRTELSNVHPFVVENGAAIFIPVGYFDVMPDDCIERDCFWVRESSAPRDYWQALLAQIEPEFGGQFSSFAAAGDDGVAAMTGLSPAAAALANQREYSEPVQWRGDEAGRRRFVSTLTALGAEPLQGGRFISVSGHCHKGRALRWLQRQYEHFRGETCTSLAIGDSPNDVAMLEAATQALVIRSPVHAPPSLARSEGVRISTAEGPAGWAEGVSRWLAAA